MSRIKGKAAIVGIGEVPTGRHGDKAAIDFAVTSARQAIMDAGINKDEIDFVMPTGAVFNGQFNNDLVTCRLVEELGLKNVKTNVQVFAGGASGSCLVKTAASLIAAGVARNVLCVHADKLGTGLTGGQAGIDLFSTAGISGEWEVPFGQHYSTIAALSMTRYMHETGCTNADMAAVCVSNRKWAELNPNAFFRKPLTVEEVLASKILASPLHAKMSNMLFDGGSAFVMTSGERARDLCQRPVYLLGESSRVTHFVHSQEKDITRFGWAEASREAFAEAGLTPADVDVAEIYDSYPIYQLITFEELGFAQRGEGGKRFQNGETGPGGSIPTTTNGGMLSQGHTGAGGGVALVVEAARQLMNKAGDRQVPGARFAVETGTGGTYMDAQVTVFGTEIP
ncbi:MAG: thiolase family protein [Desulfobacterales bacterium]|nr:thiolase family protein [Desulfobacterales bacterium]